MVAVPAGYDDAQNGANDCPNGNPDCHGSNLRTAKEAEAVPDVCNSKAEVAEVPKSPIFSNYSKAPEIRPGIC